MDPDSTRGMFAHMRVGGPRPRAQIVDQLREREEGGRYDIDPDAARLVQAWWPIVADTLLPALLDRFPPALPSHRVSLRLTLQGHPRPAGFGALQWAVDSSYQRRGRPVHARISILDEQEDEGDATVVVDRAALFDSERPHARAVLRVLHTPPADPTRVRVATVSVALWLSGRVRVAVAPPWLQAGATELAEDVPLDGDVASFAAAFGPRHAAAAVADDVGTRLALPAAEPAGAAWWRACAAFINAVRGRCGPAACARSELFLTVQDDPEPAGFGALQEALDASRRTGHEAGARSPDENHRAFALVADSGGGGAGPYARAYLTIHPATLRVAVDFTRDRHVRVVVTSHGGTIFQGGVTAFAVAGDDLAAAVAAAAAGAAGGLY